MNSGMRLWCVQTLLLGVTTGLFLRSYGARFLLREHHTQLFAAVLVCGVAGLAARGSHASWRTHIVAVFAVGWLTLPFCEEVIEYAFGPWFHTLGCFVANLAPLFVLGGLVLSRRPRVGFVLGFAVVMASVGWRLPHAYLAISLFLVARDMGRDTQTPTRQHFALLGVGLLAGTFAAGLSFDLAATFAYGEGFTRWDRAVGYIGDGALSRWVRMATEAALVASCFAYSRDRTWGVLALSVLMPFLLVQLVLLFVDGGHLPRWSSGGCFGESHPFEHVEHIPAALLLAFAPWVYPIVGVLVGEARLVGVADGEPK